MKSRFVDSSSLNEALKNIIKSQTSADVFDEFKKWYEENWDKESADFEAYMESIGFIVE